MTNHSTTSKNPFDIFIVGKLTALGAKIRRVETFESSPVSEDAG